MSKYTDLHVTPIVIRGGVEHNITDKDGNPISVEFGHVNTQKNFVAGIRTIDGIRTITNQLFGKLIDAVNDLNDDNTTATAINGAAKAMKLEINKETVTDVDILDALGTPFNPPVEGVRVSPDGTITRAKDGTVIGIKVGDICYRANDFGFTFKKATFSKLFHAVVDVAFNTPDLLALVRDASTADKALGLKKTTAAIVLRLTHGDYYTATEIEK